MDSKNPPAAIFSPTFVNQFLACQAAGTRLPMLVMDRRCTIDELDASLFFERKGRSCFGYKEHEIWEVMGGEFAINVDRWAFIYLKLECDVKPYFFQWLEVAKAAGTQLKRPLNELGHPIAEFSGEKVWCLTMNAVLELTGLVPGRGPIRTDSREFIKAAIAELNGDALPYPCVHFIYPNAIQSSVTLAQLLTEDSGLLANLFGTARQNSKKRRPKPTKEQGEAKRRQCLAMLSEHPTLQHRPQQLADSLGVHRTTIDRWLQAFDEQSKRR